MKHVHRHVITGFLGITALTLAACGNSEFGGTARTQTSGKSGSKPMSGEAQPNGGGPADDGFVNVSVSYTEEEASGLNLVEKALTDYKADLVGGDTCWGGQATPFSDSVASPTLKLRKGAAGCKLVFKELTIKDPAASVVKSAAGLASDAAATLYVDFATDDAATTISVKSQNGLSNSADSTIKLVGRVSKIVPVDTTIANEELSVSATGDLVAYPNVKIMTGPFLFKGAIRAKLNCITKVASAPACVPAVASGGAAGTQPFDHMEAAIAVLKGAPANTFPASLTQPNLDSLFASGKIGGVTQGLSPIASAVINATAGTMDFNDMTLPAIAAGNKPVLVVRYNETVGNDTVYAYKVFALSL